MWPFKTKKASIARLNDTPILSELPLYQQFNRIGGGIGPVQVSNILREADCGRPAHLVDLFHENRAKDGHLQSICSTREGAVGLCELRFVVPEDASSETEETKLCRRVVDDFENWPTLLEHLSGSFVNGHSTAVLDWKKTEDGLLLPYRAKSVPDREFFFSTDNGQILYAPDPNFITDESGVDLLAENPGRVVQVTRRITGDVLAREGLIRVLSWGALFRNWSIRDWLALGEIGWKPWRIGVYEKGTDPEDITGLVRLLERIGSSGIGVIPDTTDVRIEWPTSNRASSSGDHQAFFITVGREMSKAVLGTTSSVEESTGGDRAATQTRDQLRVDIRKRDAIVLASFLRTQIFSYVIAVNLGKGRQVPVPWFQADDAVDMLTFSSAVKNMSIAGLRIPQRWARTEFGSPQPKEGEEVIGTSAGAPGSRHEAEDPVMGPKPGASGDGGDHVGTDGKPAKKAA